MWLALISAFQTAASFLSHENVFNVFFSYLVIEKNLQTRRNVTVITKYCPLLISHHLWYVQRTQWICTRKWSSYSKVRYAYRFTQRVLGDSHFLGGSFGRQSSKCRSNSQAGNFTLHTGQDTSVTKTMLIFK